MKKLSCYIGLLMATLWLSACKSDTPLEPETTVGDGEQVLEITVDGDFYASSRSTAASAGYKLASSQAIQHIEHLYAYIFKGSDESAKCVYVTEIPWKQNSQQGSASLTYRLKEANLPQYVTDGKPSDMQVLVVAVDNNTDTYNFPYDGVANHADDTNNSGGNNPIIGQPLSNVKLKLAEAAAETTTSDEDKAFKMANTEVFSGIASFKADDQIIKVSLQRCVAGVLCYLTDIPYYVGSGTDNTDNVISSLELQLGNNLNLNTEYASFYDGTRFGSEPLSNNVIASVNILEYIYGKGTTSGTLYVQESDQSLTDKNTQRLYVPAMDNGVVKTKENTILFGAYLLPIENTATDDNTKATLKLVLKANNEGQQTAFIVKNTVTSVPGEPDASGSPTTITEPAYAYSLKANRLYSIGSKPFATDTDADQPASLKGKKIELNVLEWSNGNEDGTNDVNFPVYSLKSTISADWDTQYENYIFNCMSETRTVYIYPSEEDAQSLNFKVQVAYSDEFKNNPWVKFRFIDEETGKPFGGDDDWYTTIDNIPEELNGKARMALEVRLNDYVKENDILGNSSITDKKDALLKDYRTANLQLVNSSNATVLSSVPIQQFNAITVKFDYDKKSYTVGFSRVDLWDTMADNGVAKGEGRYDTWGFPGIVIPWYIYGTTYDSNVDGEDNSDAAEKINHSDYTTSVLYYARVKTVDDELGDGRHWYLPAREELGAFFNNVVKKIGSYNVNNLIEVVNVHHDAFYWTSSSDGSDNGRNSYVMKDTDSEPSGMRREQSAYCRQARKFN